MRLRNIGNSHQGLMHQTQRPFRALFKKGDIPKLDLSKTYEPALAILEASLAADPELRKLFAYDPQGALAPIAESLAAAEDEIIRMKRALRVHIYNLAVTCQREQLQADLQRARAGKTVLKLPESQPTEFMTVEVALHSNALVERKG